MPVVAVPDAIPHPRAMVVEPAYTAAALSTVVGSERSTSHALDAEVGTVQSTRVDEFFSDGFEISIAGNVSGIGADCLVQMVRARRAGNDKNGGGEEMSRCACVSFDLFCTHLARV